MCIMSSLTDFKSSQVVWVVWAVNERHATHHIFARVASHTGLLCLSSHWHFESSRRFVRLPESSTTPISTPALTPKAVTPMLSLCAVTKGRGWTSNRGSGRGLAKVQQRSLSYCTCAFHVAKLEGTNPAACLRSDQKKSSLLSTTVTHACHQQHIVLHLG